MQFTTIKTHSPQLQDPMDRKGLEPMNMTIICLTNSESSGSVTAVVDLLTDASSLLGQVGQERTWQKLLQKHEC